MSWSKPPMTYPNAQSITMKLGKLMIQELQNMATKESIKQMKNITTTELVKDALHKTYPAYISDRH